MSFESIDLALDLEQIPGLILGRNVMVKGSCVGGIHSVLVREPEEIDGVIAPPFHTLRCVVVVHLDYDNVGHADE